MTHSSGFKIAFVSTFPPGKLSLNEYGLHFARALADRPDVAEVVVLADLLPPDMQGLAELDLGPKIRVLRVWRFNSIGASLALLRSIRAERPDLAIFNLQTASFGDREVPAALGLMVPMAARMLGTRSGIIAHNIIAGVDLEQTILKGQRLRQAIVKTAGAIVTRAMMQATYVTTTLQSYVDILKSSYPRANVTLVPHGTFDTTKRPWNPHSNRARRIVTMGKFGTYKRLETLLAAFDILRAARPQDGLQLVIGGTDHPNTQGYVAGLAATRAQDPDVIFHGYVAEEGVADFFESSLISVFDYESTTGSSGVLHQTASYGSVPVFPHIGDFVDVCRDEGLNGYDYAPGDAKAMAAAMDRVLQDPIAAEEMARANRESALGMPMSEVVDFHIQKIK